MAKSATTARKDRTHQHRIMFSDEEWRVLGELSDAQGVERPAFVRQLLRAVHTMPQREQRLVFSAMSGGRKRAAKAKAA